MRACSATLLCVTVVCVSAQTSPRLPYLFQTSFVYTVEFPDDQSMLAFEGWQGERGTNGVTGVAYSTQRLDVALSSPGTRDSTPMAVTSIDLVYKANGTSRSVSFWSTGLLNSAVNGFPAIGGSSRRTTSSDATTDNATTLAASPSLAPTVSCAGEQTLPVPWEALNWDWIIPGLIQYAGNETISTAYYTNITTAHWYTWCKDVWLIDYVDPSESGTVYTVPVLYRLSDSSETAFECSGNNRSVEYNGTVLLQTADGSQDSSVFAIPAACNATGGPGGATLSTGDIPVVWLVVGCLLCLAIGGVVGVIIGRRQVFSQLQATTGKMRDAFTKPLVDAF